MTPELRNLPHIASMAFNEPLLLEPAYARVFSLRARWSVRYHPSDRHRVGRYAWRRADG